ncbi:tagaturonate reductase [Salinimicrobium sediminis]|uniref:Tagaturonate reductase n=1 Tax=Salinimicrobium sediminis TaxID=1343891 RepID=A0A285X1Y7_9FLAO|nr:tagaturonate reductase [Salinimicrobium sediminis]SOC79318.1 tagaturonate reductase [Salinimicrobium sediminis]
MERLNRKTAGITSDLPIKVVQFGEGNFLRAFVDYLIDKLNKEADFNAGVAVVQPIDAGLVEMLNEQDGLYNLFMRGVKGGKEIQEKRTISCIQRSLNPYQDYSAYLDLATEEELQFLISNTTEAGIAFNGSDALENVPHNSFPAKVTALLYKRYQHFNGAADKGLTIVPCELINYNADNLKEIILEYVELWKLDGNFKNWIEQHNTFHNTLVDRIVPGYPRAEIEEYQSQLEFEDKLIVTAEVFLLWVIEGGEAFKSKIPFDKIDENVLIVKDIQPYRTRKVRILNGAHTTMVPFAILSGKETVKETVDDEFTGKFVKNAIFEEINPTLDLAEEELNSFASEVLDRFRNPFIKHQLASIALNSISKFKVRVLPSLLEYQKRKSTLPVRLTFAFACLIRFYKGEWKGETLPVQDDQQIKDFFSRVWKKDDLEELTQEVLKKEDYWGQDLTIVPELKEQIKVAIKELEEKGVEEGFRSFREKTKVKS